MDRELQRGWRLLLGAAALVVVIAGLKAASVFFLPLFLALFLTILSLPLLRWLRGHRVPAVAAIALTMLAVVAILGLVALVLSASIDSLTEKLPAYQEQAREGAGRLLGWLEVRGIDLAERISTEALDLGAVVNVIGNTFRGVATALSSFLLVLLMLIFMLWESIILPGKLAVAERRGHFDFARLAPIVSRVQRYLILKTAVSLATGMAVGLVTFFVGLDFALFWGFIAFVLNYIPNVGSLLAALPAIALSLIQLGPARTLVIAAGYLVINVVFGNLVEPAVMGRGLRLSPLAIFLSLIFWGWLWGALGMILSVPLTVSLKILFENTEDLTWVAALLDRRPRETS